jgi:polyhydroxyalkanoate synthase subunit PhaC
MEKESEMTIQEGAQNGGTPGEPPQTKPSGKKTASTSNASQQNANNEGLVQAALEEEQRKAAAAQAAVEDLQRRLAEVEAALVEERRKAAQAERSLAEQGRTAEKPTEVAEQATEAAGGQTTGFGLTPFVGVKGADIFAAGQQVLQQAIQQQPLAMKTYTNYLLELGHIWSSQSSVEPDAKDKRFADDMWKTNPFYHAWMQTYLTWRDSINAFLDEADMDKKDVERARFLLSLYTEAAAPTNTLLGNPAAMKKMYETGGASLVRGLTHMIEDLTNNGGLPSQVNMKAFQVGQNLALSPGAVVFKNEVLELIQYQPTTQAVYRRPLLLAPPQVNKFYVLDLSPGKSLIQYLVGSGFQVFLISWRNPTPQQREWGFDTYDRAILQAIDVVRAITGSEDINILGACLAGMTLATLLGHLAAQRDRRIHAATFLVTVLDSNMESTLGLFATKETIEAAKQASRSKGVVEGQELARAFAWLRPNDLIWNYWVNNYLIGNDPAAFDVLYWNNDTTRLPAKIHGEMLDLFETNAFTHPGMLKALGTPIDLSKVTMDAYIIAGITDHITPWQVCYATTQLLGGTCKFILSNSGHIQAIINPPGNPKAKYFVNTRYPADAQQWLAGAKPRSGSWWEDYSGWLGERAGGQKPAPEVLGNDQYPPGIPAPGTYVFEP